MKSVSLFAIGRKAVRYPAAGLLLILVVLAPETAQAQADSPVDWRGSLSCPPEHQLHDGLLYCTHRDGTGQTFHVVVADLTATGLRFEYILPKGTSDRFPPEETCGVDAKVEECRDPNLPAWGGPEKGCFVPCSRGQYPRITLAQAVGRAEQVRGSPPLVAVINGDYFGPGGTHGPEGLMVVRGERLDGAALCDDDYNAALRPWLGLEQQLDPDAGRLRAAIDRLDRDSAPLPAWLYTGIGGGPWLVRDSEPVPGAAGCLEQHVLHEIDPVDNCTGAKKTAPSSETEAYNEGSCRSAPHTAAGISRDGRWLFLVVSDANAPPQVMAGFMRHQLHAWDVLKFDGGGSSHLWFGGSSPIAIDPARSNRPLSSYLAVYGEPGGGIALPLDATPLERVHYQVVTRGETAEFSLEIQNTGDYAWAPEDGIELRSEPFTMLSPVVDAQPLEGTVRPGETAQWAWEAGSGSFAFRRFQMTREGEPFGTDFAVVVVSLPEGSEELRQEVERALQELIDEWKARGEDELDGLVQEMEVRVKDIIEDLLREALDELEEVVEEGSSTTCSSAWIGLGMVAGASWLGARRRRR